MVNYFIFTSALSLITYLAFNYELIVLKQHGILILQTNQTDLFNYLWFLKTETKTNSIHIKKTIKFILIQTNLTTTDIHVNIRGRLKRDCIP